MRSEHIPEYLKKEITSCDLLVVDDYFRSVRMCCFHLQGVRVFFYPEASTASYPQPWEYHISPRRSCFIVSASYHFGNEKVVDRNVI